MGSDFWDYRRPFVEPKQVKDNASLFVSPPRIGWKTLEQINDPVTDTD